MLSERQTVIAADSHCFHILDRFAESGGIPPPEQWRLPAIPDAARCKEESAGEKQPTHLALPGQRSSPGAAGHQNQAGQTSPPPSSATVLCFCIEWRGKFNTHTLDWEKNSTFVLPLSFKGWRGWRGSRPPWWTSVSRSRWFATRREDTTTLTTTVGRSTLKPPARTPASPPTHPLPLRRPAGEIRQGNVTPQRSTKRDAKSCLNPLCLMWFTKLCIDIVRALCGLLACELLPCLYMVNLKLCFPPVFLCTSV